MTNGKDAVGFTMAYNQNDDKILVSFGDKDNTIAIPSNMYRPFVSVLIQAGVDFQKNKVVDLGFTDFIKAIEEE
jgi:hypothetical protein